MLRRLFSRSLFCNRRQDAGDHHSNDHHHENGDSSRGRPEDDAYFHRCRIGWWPIVRDRDQPLVDALATGRYRLISSVERDHDWAYAAVHVGPLHTEIVRWHFPSARWFRMPVDLSINNDQPPPSWSICWRPLPRPPDDHVSGVAQGPFRNWDVLAGEVDFSTDPKRGVPGASVAVVLRTIRTNSGALAADYIYSLIVISEYGRTKQGYLLSPLPDDNRKGTHLKTYLSYFMAYRREHHQLHFLCYDSHEQSITWYRYKKRGRRVYWMEDKRVVQLADTSLLADRVYDLRDGGDTLRLVNGLASDDTCVELNLDRCEWSLMAAESIMKLNEYGGKYAADFLQTISTRTRRPSSQSPSTGAVVAAAHRSSVPALIQFNVPFTLKSICARTILRHTHPRYLNNPANLLNALPPDRFVLQAISEVLVR